MMIRIIKIIKNKIRPSYNLFKKIINQNFFKPYNGLKKYDLIIFDNIYPHPVSGFRHEEFTVLLSEFRKSKIILYPSAYSVLKTPVSEHKKHIKELVSLNMQLQIKLELKKGFVNINTKLFYCVFLGNIFDNLEWIEKNKIPFVFTLYPGGGFHVDDILSDMKLKKVLESPMFRKVIVNQLFTQDYLIKKNFCKIENIKFIFGGVVPQQSLKKKLTCKKTFLINKDTFDICFCAAKYMPKGEDKGYDVFVEAAYKIAAEFDFVRFHIVGGFTENDIDISKHKSIFQFYGYQNFDNLEAILKKIDVLVSPNKPFLLSKGAFDGFPLGTVVEAALNGVVVLITDELRQNTIFIPNEDLILIESKSSSIQKEIIDLIHEPQKLYLISKKGKKKFAKVYSNEVQMQPRIELLKKEILKA